MGCDIWEKWVGGVLSRIEKRYTTQSEYKGRMGGVKIWALWGEGGLRVYEKLARTCLPCGWGWVGLGGGWVGWGGVRLGWVAWGGVGWG